MFVLFTVALVSAIESGVDSADLTSATLDQAAPVKSIVVSASGSEATDTAAIQAAVESAASTGRPLVLDASKQSFRTSATINFRPPESKTQVWMHIVAYNSGGPTIDYSGTGPAIRMYGVKNSLVSQLRVRCLSPESVGFLVSTKDNIQSTSNLTFSHCSVSTVGAGTRGWDIGPEGAGAADISNIVWQNCTVNGDREHFQGAGGFFVHGGNTLNLSWRDSNVSYEHGPGWSFWNDPHYTPSSGGGSSSILNNCGGSYVDQIVRMQGGFLVSVFGGRSELSGVAGGGLFESGAGGGLGGALNVNGYTAEGFTGSFAKGGNQTKVIVTSCVVNRALVNGYYLNGTTLTPN